MGRKRTYRLGDLQLQIMKILWKDGQASVGQVQEQLADKSLAYTTVATMLRKMEQRGLLRHRQDGRKFIYQPAVTEKEVSRSITDHFVERLFEGSLADAVSHLLATREIDPGELDRLEQLIKERRRGR